MRLVSEKESVDLIPPIYDAMRAVTPGAITRSTDWWTVRILADPEYSRQGASEKYRVVYQADGEPEGYAIYRIKSDWDHLGPKGVLQVNDAVATSPQALRGLWRYLFDVDLVRSVKAEHVAVPNPLQQVLAEPRALGLVASDGIWARLVDAPAALRARRYMTTGELVLDIADNVCEWNAGRWRLSTSGSVGATEAVVEATDDSPDLALDVADLGAIYLGGTSIAELAAVGRIKERREGAVAQADALFATGSTPWCNTMF